MPGPTVDELHSHAFIVADLMSGLWALAVCSTRPGWIPADTLKCIFQRRL